MLPWGHVPDSLAQWTQMSNQIYSSWRVPCHGCSVLCHRLFPNHAHVLMPNTVIYLDTVRTEWPRSFSETTQLHSGCAQPGDVECHLWVSTSYYHLHTQWELLWGSPAPLRLKLPPDGCSQILVNGTPYCWNQNLSFHDCPCLSKYHDPTTGCFQVLEPQLLPCPFQERAMLWN